jgi:hypothetical protein
MDGGNKNETPTVRRCSRERSRKNPISRVGLIFDIRQLRSIFTAKTVFPITMG